MHLQKGRSAHARIVVAGFWAALAVLLPSPARATWSIVAVDPRTGDVGFAGATCGVGIQFVPALSPRHGAVASQAATSFAGRDHASTWISEGLTPDRIVERLKDPKSYSGFFGGDVSVMQYGVVSFSGPAATYSGAEIPAPANAETGVNYSVQGNTLRSPAVVTKAAAAFRIERVGSCQLELSDRLLAALEAGRDAGGDSRCPEGAPAQSAALIVMRPGDTPTRMAIDIVKPRKFSFVEGAWYSIFPYHPSPGEDPIRSLRNEYDREKRGAACRFDLNQRNAPKH